MICSTQEKLSKNVFQEVDISLISLSCSKIKTNVVRFIQSFSVLLNRVTRQTLYYKSIDTSRFYLTGGMMNLYSFIRGSLERPLSELFFCDASLLSQYKFIAFNIFLSKF